MSRRDSEASVEFTCVGNCDRDDPITWKVEGRFNAEGQFEPTEIDEMGSDMDCPECGERGEPTDGTQVADL